MCGYNWFKVIYVKIYIVGWFFVVGIIFIGIMGLLYY